MTVHAKPIECTCFEEAYTLRGGLEDPSLAQTWGIGACVYREPGMKHGPYRATSDGCLLFVKIGIVNR